jgi:hypothetical protein
MQAPAGPLIAGHSFGQTFVAEHDGMSKVELMVATYAAKLPAGEVILHLCQYPNIQNQIASATVPATTIKDNSYIALQFAPIRNSSGKTYYLYVETHNIPPKYALTVWRSNGDVYPDGHFLVDGQPQTSDTCFRDFYGASPSAVINGFLIGSKEDGRVYLAKNGRLRWILQPAWLTAHGYASQQPIWLSAYEIHRIPSGPCLIYVTVTTVVTLGIYWTVLFLFFFFTLYDRNWLKQAWAHASVLKNTFWFKHYRGVLLSGFLALMCLRAPWLLTHPRFWAEEGSAWFRYASAHPLIRDIAYIYPESGYLNLMANIGGVLSSSTARFFNVDYAPLSTTVAALLIQVLATGIILFGKSRLFTSPQRAVAGCLIVLFAPTSVPEVWLNTINSMSYLGLIALLLLFEDVSLWSAFTKWAGRIMLVLCGLSAAYSIALLPLFGFSAFRFKERERRVHCYILIACLLIQVGCVAYSKLSGGGLPNRGTNVSADISSVNVLFWQMLVPALGNTGALLLFGAFGGIGVWLTASFFPHVQDPNIRVAGLICFLASVSIFSVLIIYGRNLTKIILAAAFGLFAVLTCVGSLHSIPSGRYAFLPGIVFMFLLLSNIQPGARTRSLISMTILALGLANGMMDFRVAPDPNAPRWPQEIAKWNADHNYHIKILPPSWTIAYHPSE